MRDVVVILPGITGSVLQKDGKDLWAVSGGGSMASLQSPMEKSLQQLKLDGDDPELEDLGGRDQSYTGSSRCPPCTGLGQSRWIHGDISSDLITDYCQVEQGDIYHSDKPENFLQVPLRLAAR
jgi:hypothetical protein